MLNLAYLKDLLQKRNIKLDIKTLAVLEKKRSLLNQQIQALRAERNQISQEDTPINRQRGKQIKEELKKLEKQLTEVDLEYKTLFNKLPNDLDPAVPLGKTEADNKVVKTYQAKPQFSFRPHDHLTLGKKLDILDFEKGAKVAGSHFYFLKNAAVDLEFALMKFALDFLKKEGFTLYQTPDLAKQFILDGLGFAPRGPETQIYNLENSDLSLIGTAEVTLGGYYAGEILKKEQLPLKMAGFSHCFRTEAGGYGRESRGLYRVHQFSKVEMFIYAHPSESAKMLEYLVSLEEKIYQALDFPYRVVDICAGELGAPAYGKFDLEVWLPGLAKWGELTSASNCTAYQAKRLKIKYRKKDGSTDYVHTLNGTAIASARSIIAILELFQNKDGSVNIPKVLQPYTGFAVIKPHVS